MHVDFKITAWERIGIPEDMEAAVLKGLEDGTIENSFDLIDFLDKQGKSFDNQGMIIETEEQYPVSENDGQSTIEFFNDDENLEGKAKWDNSEKS